MAELGLAVVATIDLCLRHGKEIHKLCSAFKGAESDLEERSLRVENGWHRCITQLRFLKDAWETMEEAHQDLQERTLHMFASKLSVATMRLQKVVKSDVAYNSSEYEVRVIPKPLKYALKKASLDEAIEALETWQRMSDPSWFLLLRSTKPALSNVISEDKQQLKSSIPSVFGIHPGLRDTPSKDNHIGGLRLPGKALGNIEVIDLPLCSASVAKTKGSTKSINYVLDRFDTRHLPFQKLLEDSVRKLAHKLRHAEPENFNLLQSKGFVDQYGDQPLTMFFRAPSKLSNPQSLRHCLTKNGPPSSLSHRFEMAQQLARAVSYVHVYGFVHKCVTPESILLLDKEGSDSPTLFLVGFGEFRHGLQISGMQGDENLEKNLYRHPFRQGCEPDEKYAMQHDIYSLGICLLEIGLWTTFIDYDESGQNTSLSSVFQIDDRSSGKEVRNFLRSKSQGRFLELARTELKVSMGSEYASITETCISCLESDNEDFGDLEDFEDDLTEEEETQVGVQYIDKVLHRLSTLRV